MDNLGTASPLSIADKWDITFHPNSSQIARRCKQANECASKQLSVDMEKLTLEEQKACQRVEKEQDLLCQEFLGAKDHCEDGRKLSDTSKPRYAKRVQRSKTVDFRQVYSPPRVGIKGGSFTLDEFSPGIQRTTSFKTIGRGSISSTSQSSLRSISSISSEQQQLQQHQTLDQGEDRGSRRKSHEEVQPDWQIALALKRRQKLSQLQMFREMGHWGEDGCQKATAMLTGCPFNPISPGSTALSYVGKVVANEDTDTH
ncbi:unnamed protein product [Hydatigera taeniaeformis]|uniref:Uncharacterized protein n=1 Tax=Hydatigena taeniaeformis TaxID=6205 RepID=A0A0R3X1G5_HYDTA|nr:unnamed protein product [Hydatigera taeniaeformis]